MTTPTPAPEGATLTAMVRAAGLDLDGLGAPGLGRFYLVLEIPQGQNAMVHAALVSGRIKLSAASS